MNHPASSLTAKFVAAMLLLIAASDFAG